MPWNVSWLNQNADRAYPLAATASAQDESGTITLPQSFMLALYLPVNAGMAVVSSAFYLQSLLISGSGFNIAIGYNDDSDSPPIVAAVNIAASTHVENNTYALPGINDFADTSGQIVIGALAEINLLPPGQYTFSPAAGQLETDCVRPMIRGITAITLVNGTDVSAPLSGDLEFVAGTNFRLTPVITEGQDPQIVFSAIAGEGLNEDCECDQNELGPCIRTINGIQPTGDGNFTLSGDSCLSLAPATNGLNLEIAAACGTPCCGCADLAALNAQLTAFGTAITTLQNTASRLDATTTETSLVVLGSRLGDSSCVSC